MCDTTDMEKLRILTMWECGKSPIEIAKSVNKSTRTVQRWISHHKREGHMNKKPRGLRPRKTTPEEDAKIIQLVRENPELTQKEILTICNLNIYKSTLRRRIREANGIYNLDLFPSCKDKKKGKKVKKTEKDRKEDGPKHTECLLDTFSSSVNEGAANIGEHKGFEFVEAQVFTEEAHFDTDTDSDRLFSFVGTDIQTDVGSLHVENVYSNFAQNVKVEVLEVDKLPSEGIILSHDMSSISSVLEETKIKKNRRKTELNSLTDVDSVEMPIGGVRDDLLGSLAGDEEVHEEDEAPLMGHFLECVRMDEVKVSAPTKRKRAKLLCDGSQCVEGSECECQLPEKLKKLVRRAKVNERKELLDKARLEKELAKKEQKDVEVKGKMKKVEKRANGEKEAMKDERVRGKDVRKGENQRGRAKKGNVKEEKRKRVKKEIVDWEKDRKDTTDIEKNKILIMAECGMTTVDIAKALKKSIRTVQRWISKHNRGLDMEKKERGRRPRKTSPEEDARIVQLVKENPTLSRDEILQMAGITLHKVTLKNRLNEAGMFFNNQGVKILDFSAEEKTAEANIRDDEENAMIITCSSLTPTPAITNAILTCPTLSTTLIITNPEDDEVHNIGTHSQTTAGGCFADYSMY